MKKIAEKKQKILNWLSGIKLPLWVKNNLDIVLAVSITVIGFFYLFGLKILDFNNKDFVTTGGDFSVSYWGGVFYRLDEWRWPIFTHLNMAYPYGISIHGTDGGPLLSVIFKLLTTLFGLNPEGQFVGIWTFIIYTLQAYVAVLIFRHGIKNKWLISVAALFFVTCPILLMRSFVHINLMAHFVFLFAILLWLNDKLGKKEWFYMAVLYSLAMLTCPYFLPMQTGFFAILIYKKVFVEKKVTIKQMIKGMLMLLLILLFWFYMLGMVQSGQSLSEGDWRLFNAGLNLAGLMNPAWTLSNAFNNLTPGAFFETDVYFGLGLLILLCVLFPSVKALFKTENLKKNWTISLLIFGLVFFALSPVVKLGTVTVLSYKLGPVFDWVGSVFRYSARMFWPVWYLLAFFLIKTFCNKFPKKAWWLLPLILLIQLWDLKPTLLDRANFIKNAKPYEYPLKSSEWDRLANQYDNVFIFNRTKNYEAIWQWAIKYRKNINFGFLNRPSKKTMQLVDSVREQILSGYISSEYANYFFVIDDDLMKRINEGAKYNSALDNLKNHIYHLDKYDVLEFSPDISDPVEYQAQTIPVSHRYWTADLVQTSPSRVYRSVDNRKDFATITEYDDEMLVLKWDHYGIEKFKKEADGRYHQIVKD